MEACVIPRVAVPVAVVPPTEAAPKVTVVAPEYPVPPVPTVADVMPPVRVAIALAPNPEPLESEIVTVGGTSKPFPISEILIFVICPSELVLTAAEPAPSPVEITT